MRIALDELVVQVMCNLQGKIIATLNDLPIKNSSCPHYTPVLISSAPRSIAGLGTLYSIRYGEVDIGKFKNDSSKK